jgi:hypothetical protein
MGIIVLDPYTSKQGVTWLNAYISIADALVSTVKQEANELTTYELSCNFRVYYSQQARDDGKPPLGTEYIQTSSPTPVTTDVYTVLYTALKAKYPNSVDA